MPNRGQINDRNRLDQRQNGGKNPGTFSPDDDEPLEAETTQLAAQNPPRGRKGRDIHEPEEQPVIEQEDEEAEDEDDADELGVRP